MGIERQIVNTSKGRLQYNISGNGSPAIVLINGGSGPIEGWMRILPQLANWSSVFSYNRFGVAGSDKPQEPQDGLTIIETLREVLKIIGLEPPYVLVGHSLGGLYANLYARRYPNEIAGVVFLESSHPKDIELEAYQGKVIKRINKILSVFDSLSPYKKFNEVNFVKETVQQILTANAFPDIPVYVISGEKNNKMMPEIVRTKRLEHQLELLSLSANSKHFSAKNSGHFPQFSEPQIVINAIRECWEQMKGNL
ncbi:2-succinyl-6-hydroxy-2, 4-cyclohexadiene-1-carboxylate synthase [Paenibacillus auburnensis]|uniref:2-succinyl-6-hydroxy-2, 4-cyclohexadiene-1-carboxylate synthase n=1 Tax=Paenibacillus auburnensis TaxID=2905649 RepID=A0ABM9BP86_9BACL|nr:alpha/beta hydrolase [Paenibacillus auburnensis]CAH1191625.1 2-succinyl-6-hydroxy-2, 4-cyclohexadiene-1-carboxylate synthase [Paenibacillus auburnensis]